MNKVLVVGSYVQDLTFNTEKFPVEGETVVGEFTSGHGGKGSNQAIAAARLGSDVFFIGCVGEDVFGNEVGEFLAEENIEAQIFFSNKPTGAASIIVDKEGKNSIVVSLGANKELNGYNVKEFVQDLGLEFDVILTQLEAGRDTQSIEQILYLKWFSDENKISILNPAPMSNIFNESILSLIDIITPNETEFISLYNRVSGEGAHISIFDNTYLVSCQEDIAKMCECLEIPYIVITMGERGVFLYSYINKDYRIFPSLKVEVKSTAGAGDAFSGALASFLAKSENRILLASNFIETLIEGVKFSIVASGLSVTKEGTSPSMPYIEEVEQALNTYAHI